MPIGQQYVDPVSRVEVSDTLQISQQEIEDFNNVILYTESIMIKDSEVFANGRKIHSVKEANELYRKVIIDQSLTMVNHRIWCTGFLIHRTYYRRAGRRLLKYMRTYQFNTLEPKQSHAGAGIISSDMTVSELWRNM